MAEPRSIKFSIVGGWRNSPIIFLTFRIARDELFAKADESVRIFMNDTVRQHFDKLSSTYRGHFDARRTGANFSFHRRRELACELANGVSGRLMDCASGTGEITAALLKKGQFEEAVVVDISEEMLVATRAAIEAVSPALPTCFIRSDIFLLDAVALDGRFDLIVCLGLIAHTGRLDALLSKLAALLTPGTGRILLQTSLADQWGVATTRAISARLVSVRTGYQLSYYRHDDICHACATTGFKIVNTRRHTVGIPFGDRIWPRGNYWIERQLAGWANKHGGEALYLLAQAE